MNKIFIYTIFIFLCFLLSLNTINLIKCKHQIKQLENIITELNNKTKDTNSVSEIDLIEVKVKKCIEKDYSTTAMSKCVQNSYNDWNLKIEQYILYLKNILDYDQYLLLNQSQKKWLEYKNVQWILLDKTQGKKEGTIHRNITDASKANILKIRSQELEALYFFLSKN